MYQILKFASFEGSGIYYALGAVTLLIAGLVVLPFIDRGSERNPRVRPVYTTIGIILVAELIVLTVWGFLTPGQVIPDVEALEVTGTVALAFALISAFVFKKTGTRRIASAKASILRAMVLPFKNRWVTSIFVVLLCAGSVCFANVVGSFSGGLVNAPVLALNSAGLFTSFYVMARIIRNLAMAYGSSQF
jgi:hypothetical protein